MSDENKKYKRILVTSALPYANGPIHIGHMAGVYIPSDIYVRYQRLRHRDVIHICGNNMMMRRSRVRENLPDLVL